MPSRTRDKESHTASQFAENTNDDDPVVSPLSTSSSVSRSRPVRGDIESGNYSHQPSIGRNSVSFEEDTNIPPSVLAAAAAAGAAAAASVNNRGSNSSKSKKRPTSLRSPSSVMTSPTMTSEESNDSTPSSGPTVLTLEHRVKQKKSNKLLKMLLKPSVLAAGAVILMLTGTFEQLCITPASSYWHDPNTRTHLNYVGGTAFFFTRWLSIPGLNEQIERLQAEVDGLELQVDELEEQVDRLGLEVDRLGDEVDRLAVENDRFAKLNEELESNVAAYVRENERLNESLAEYEELNSQLDSSVNQLRLINEQLAQQNDEYAGLNNELNSTIAGTLLPAINRLEIIANNLTASNRELRELNEGLSNETLRLMDLKDDLNETVTSLGNEVDNLSEENRRLASLNADLTLVVTFLNDTAVGIHGTYEDITEFLAEQITAHRVLALETLQNLYMQRISRWDCDFQSFFLTEPFATNRTIPIGKANYPRVMEYVDERVLSELCLDESDFERYMETDLLVSPERATMNQIVSRVSFYTTGALEYYFPSGDSDEGVTSEDWSEAGFDCENLPVDKSYSHFS